MNFSSAPVPEHPSGPPDAVAITQYRKQMERMNCGFDKVEILSGNIGYVKFDMFAADQTHLNDLWERKSDETHQYWTSPFVPGKRLDGIPAYVLTSGQTFSGAEEFSYNLKNLKRATIVGETTGGGAHPVSGHRIDDHFMVGVPFARAINPISKTNWEGTGVEPDVKVPSADALTTAQKLAREKLASK